MKPQKVPFSNSIYSNSPLADVENFIHKLIPEFNQVLFDAGIENIFTLTPAKIIVTNKRYISKANGERIKIHLGVERNSTAFEEYKRYQKIR